MSFSRNVVRGSAGRTFVRATGSSFNASASSSSAAARAIYARQFTSSSRNGSSSSSSSSSSKTKATPYALGLLGGLGGYFGLSSDKDAKTTQEGTLKKGSEVDYQQVYNAVADSECVLPPTHPSTHTFLYSTPLLPDPPSSCSSSNRKIATESIGRSPSAFFFFTSPAGPPARPPPRTDSDHSDLRRPPDSGWQTNGRRSLGRRLFHHSHTHNHPPKSQIVAKVQRAVTQPY